MKTLIALSAAVIAALSLVAMASADHDTTDPDHPFRTTIDEQLKRNLGGSTCHFVALGGGEFLANGHNVPVRFCPWTAHADDIETARRYDAAGTVALVMGSRSFFALPPDVRLTATGHATLPGIPDGVNTFGELKISRLVQCANTPRVVYEDHLWRQGSVWCLQLSGLPATSSFSGS